MDFRYFKYNCLIVAIMFIGTMIAAYLLGFELPGPGIFKTTFLICGVSAAFAWFYTCIRKEENIAHTALGLFSFGMYLKPALLFSYVALRMDRPKIDDTLLAFDNAIGVDWPSVGNWAAGQPELMSFLSVAYQSSMQISVISLFLVGMFFRRPIQVHQFFTAILVSGFVCGFSGGLFPIDSIYRPGVIEEEVMQKIGPVMNMAVTDMINELRFGENPTLNIQGSIGVVGMPSFHTILSALLVWMARGTGWFFFVSLAWNAIIILATPLMGNHYVADVIGGLVTSAFAIWATHQIYRLIDARCEKNPNSGKLFGFAVPVFARRKEAI